MPFYMIERNFAEELDVSNEDVKLIDEINAGEDVRWLFSFLSADRRRTYCLYEAPSEDAIRAAAVRANVPVDEVVEVGPASRELSPRLREWAESQAAS
jgi:Nickel responsive protein SCO4226-like